MMEFDEKVKRQERRSERQRRRYESSHEERTMEPETKNGTVVDCELLNFRSTPDRYDRNNIVDTLKKGTKVVILERTFSSTSDETEMLKVRLDDGRVGFIASQFCQEV